MFTVNQLRMSQSSVDLITELHTQWMQTSRARTNHTFKEARVLLQEARALLRDIEEKMDEAWRVFHEELKAMEDQRDASLPKEPVTHPALEHMYDHIPYEDEEPALEHMPYEEPVPHPALEHMPYEEPVPHPALEHMPYEEPVPHPALMGHVSEHMFDHMPYEDEEPVPYEEPVPVWGYDSEDDSDEEVDNEVELLNDDELLDIVW
jgi:hypothetical protein